MFCKVVSCLIIFFVSILIIPSSKDAYAGLTPGSIYTVANGGGTDGMGELFEIDPDNGNRTSISDFGNIAQGPLGGLEGDMLGIALGNDVIYVTKVEADPNSGLFSVDPNTGNRTLLSDWTDNNQGPLGVFPADVLVDGSDIYVIDEQAGTDGRGALFKLDLSGNRTILSDFGNPGQGPLGGSPIGIGLGSNNVIWVINVDGGTGDLGTVFSIDKTSGQRTLVSDGGYQWLKPYNRFWI